MSIDSSHTGEPGLHEALGSQFYLATQDLLPPQLTKRHVQWVFMAMEAARCSNSRRVSSTPVQHTWSRLLEAGFPLSLRDELVRTGIHDALVWMPHLGGQSGNFLMDTQSLAEECRCMYPRGANFAEAYGSKRNSAAHNKQTERSEVRELREVIAPRSSAPVGSGKSSPFEACATRHATPRLATLQPQGMARLLDEMTRLLKGEYLSGPARAHSFPLDTAPSRVRAASVTAETLRSPAELTGYSGAGKAASINALLQPQKSSES